MSKTTQVEEYFGEGHLIPMGNGASQCKYCGASFLPSYTEQSTEPVKNTGQNPVNAEPGVDEELLEIQSNMRLWALSQCNHAYKMLDKAEELTCDDCLMQIVDEIIKQLLQQKPQAGQVDEELMRWLEDAYKYGDGFVPTKTYNQFKQLLTHLSTSGNNMSDKRVVTRELIQNFKYTPDNLKKLLTGLEIEVV